MGIFVTIDLLDVLVLVMVSVVVLSTAKGVWLVAKRRREAKSPYISFRDLEGGERVAVLHTDVIPKLDDLDKIFNQALDRLAMDGDVSDEDYSLALESYQTFKKERNA